MLRSRGVVVNMSACHTEDRMRLMDMQLAIPSTLLAIAIATALGPGLFNLMIAVGISSVPRFSRLLRASVLSSRFCAREIRGIPSRVSEITPCLARLHTIS